MQKTQFEIIRTVLAESIFVLLIVVAGFLLFRIYLKKKQTLLLEKERLKLEYEQTLFRSRLEIQEQTFTQISQEIHDNIGQLLSLVRLNLNTFGLPEGQIADTDDLLGRAIADLRHLSHNLNTSYVLQTRFSEAVRQLLSHLEKTRQFKTSFEGEDVEVVLPEEKGIILFRIVQEIINNIVHHARATLIKVSITDLPGVFNVFIQDNGQGFELSSLQKGSGLGLHSMRQRAALIGAELAIDTAPGRGTQVVITIKKEET